MGVVVLGLNPGGLTGQDANYMEDYANNLGLTFPLAVDIDGSYGKYTGTSKIAPFPLDVVVDASGTVLMVKRDFDIEEIKSTVQAALGQ